MKKQTSTLFPAVLASALLLLTACGSKTSESPAAASASAETSGAPQTVEAMPETLKIDALDDCTFAASFKASDVATDKDGTLTIRLSVDTYECYDMVDISRLAAGDTLVVEGKKFAVKTVDRSGADVRVNGGTEAGGYDLHTDEDGVYYIINMDAGPTYHTIGETTLPVGKDFVYTDNSDPEKPGQKLSADDFQKAMKGSDASFVPAATTVRVAGGKIVELTKNYMP